MADRDDWTVMVECATCGGDVYLYEEEPDDAPGLSIGRCCGWAYVDWWEGTFRLDTRTDAEKAPSADG